MTSPAIDLGLQALLPFLPSEDFALSRRFYEALGWTAVYADADLVRFENAGHGFYLQRYHQKDWAENTMLHLSVADARACHEQIAALLAGGDFGSARVAEPRPEPYGALVTYVWDPCGVLLHLAQWDTPRRPGSSLGQR